MVFNKEYISPLVKVIILSVDSCYMTISSLNNGREAGDIIVDPFDEGN